MPDYPRVTSPLHGLSKTTGSTKKQILQRWVTHYIEPNIRGEQQKTLVQNFQKKTQKPKERSRVQLKHTICAVARNSTVTHKPLVHHEGNTEEHGSWLEVLPSVHGQPVSNPTQRTIKPFQYLAPLQASGLFLCVPFCMIHVLVHLYSLKCLLILYWFLQPEVFSDLITVCYSHGRTVSPFHLFIWLWVNKS